MFDIRGAGYENLIVYGYDNNGNITKAGDVTYAYDEAGQLTRVNDPRYGTTVYTYDVGGNIKYVKTYDYTTGELGTCNHTVPYTYGNSTWKDLLTAYNGQTITYDGAGNPLSYRDGMSFTWEMGRQLASLSTGNKTYAYQYNADGLRIQTSDGTTNTRYTWVDGRLTSQTDGTETLYFRYDENGNPLAVLYNGTEYYYVTNLQGDIIALLDGQGNCVVEYTYDAWGKLLSKTGSMATSLGSDNPLRYRGYYYDQETGFYYLQSRYYDPATGRFINADDVEYLGASEQILSLNLFAYCENNSVNYSDPFGYAPHNLFMSSKAAALDFAYNYYNVSLYIRMEICAVLYMIKKNNKLYYSYTPYIVGEVHSCQPLNAKSWIPKDGWMIGGIHTHPNSNSFSSADFNWAKKYGSIYVITPNKSIRVYHDTRRGWKDELVYSKITLKSLSRDVSARLRRGYLAKWNMHIRTQCGFNCANKRWPAW